MEPSRKAKVYIASPYTKGDTAVNVRVSMNVFNLLMDLGCSPFCPLTTHFLHLMNPRVYDDWMDYDFEWVEVCDILLRVPGESSGADKEIIHAVKKEVLVAYSMEDLLTLLQGNGFYIKPEMTRDWLLAKYMKITSIDPEKYI